MEYFLLGVCILILSGVAACVFRRESIGVAGALVGCSLGAFASASVLFTGKVFRADVPWPVPYGSFNLEIDALSAFFLLLIFAIGALAAIYGQEYLRPYRERKSLGGSWCFYNALVGSMALVVVARNGVLFLSAWEAMALSSFFLVVFDGEKDEVQRAGWSYLIASHVGTAALLVLFVAMGRRSGSLDFDQFLPAGGSAMNWLFLLAVLGFGTKAGFFPLHVWLPEAHPAAPSHVSALMSGVMIKTGIYGLIRIYLMIGPGPAWWGWLLIVTGAMSGVLGVLFALAQHDLKRLLAYHSVENIGIIALGLGLGMLGKSVGRDQLMMLGFGGALFHVANHALFKSLLFLGAGAVAHEAGTRDIDRLGGLIKRMPWTAGCFLVGAVAICGLPPLNGLVSEFLIFLGGYRGVMDLDPRVAAPAVLAIGSLALIGGLAVACFTKAFGVVFLGQPRSGEAARAHEVKWEMRIPMLVLCGCCAAIGIGAPWVLQAVAPAISLLGGSGITAQEILRQSPMFEITFIGLLLIAVAALLTALRAWLLLGRSVGSTGTWDCGYAAPSARMQYTASSFARPLTGLFDVLLRTERRFVAPADCFPSASELFTHTPDLAARSFFQPLYRGLQKFLAKFRWLQHGHLQLYVLQMACALIILLLWKLG